MFLQMILGMACRYRPRHGSKNIICTFPGCQKTFYERKNMLQHQTLKHGRPNLGRSGGGGDWIFDEQTHSWVVRGAYKKNCLPS